MTIVARGPARRRRARTASRAGSRRRRRTRRLLSVALLRDDGVEHHATPALGAAREAICASLCGYTRKAAQARERTALGVAPYARLNTRAKCPESTKPHRNATSVTETPSLRSSSAWARASRRRRTNAATESSCSSKDDLEASQRHVQRPRDRPGRQRQLTQMPLDVLGRRRMQPRPQRDPPRLGVGRSDAASSSRVALRAATVAARSSVGSRSDSASRCGDQATRPPANAARARPPSADQDAGTTPQAPHAARTTSAYATVRAP